MIYNLIKLAFKTAKHSNGSEQDFINQLRASEHYIPELALVAKAGERIISHLILTNFTIHSEPKPFETQLLVPFAVHLAYRKQCVGSGLVG